MGKSKVKFLVFFIWLLDSNSFQFCSEGEKVSGMPSLLLSLLSPLCLMHAFSLPSLYPTLHFLLYLEVGDWVKPGQWKKNGEVTTIPLEHHALRESSTRSVGQSKVEYNYPDKFNRNPDHSTTIRLIQNESEIPD